MKIKDDGFQSKFCALIVAAAAATSLRKGRRCAEHVGRVAAYKYKP